MPGLAGASRCTTMNRLTIGIRLFALLCLVGAGMMDAMPDGDAPASYIGQVRDKVHHALHLPDWTPPSASAGHG